MRVPSNKRDQAGASAVEMALLLPVLLTIVFAVIDYGRFFYLRTSLTAAVADAARIATMPGATDAAVQASVAGALDLPINQGAGGSATVSVSPSVRVAGSPVTVSAVLPFEPLILPRFLGQTLFPEAVTASATMVVEP